MEFNFNLTTGESLLVIEALHDLERNPVRHPLDRKDATSLLYKLYKEVKEQYEEK